MDQDNIVYIQGKVAVWLSPRDWQVSPASMQGYGRTIYQAKREIGTLFQRGQLTGEALLALIQAHPTLQHDGPKAPSEQTKVALPQTLAGYPHPVLKITHCRLKNTSYDGKIKAFELWVTPTRWGNRVPSISVFEFEAWNRDAEKDTADAAFMQRAKVIDLEYFGNHAPTPP